MKHDKIMKKVNNKAKQSVVTQNGHKKLLEKGKDIPFNPEVT